jgi:hypothetical protein
VVSPIPDKYGMDHLGESGLKRCIWCGWSTHQWREPDIERHYRKHQRDRDLAVQASRREREISDRM